MKNVIEVAHPLIEHHLVRLRDERTSPADFRLSIDRLAVLLAYEATKDLAVTAKTVKTPLAVTSGRVLCQRVGIVPILRGIGHG